MNITLSSSIKLFTVCKPLAQPLSPHVLFSTDQCPTTIEEKVAMQAVPYCEAIGALNWITIGTQPNIVFVVGQLVCFMEIPHMFTGRQWSMSSDIWRGCRIGSWFMKEVKIDTDGAMQEHRWAISRYVILIDGGAISWCLKKQELVTLSTTKAEYVAAMHAAKELIWFWHLLVKYFNHSNTQLFFTQITNLLLCSLIRNGSFMPELNTSMSGGISSAIPSKKALLSLFIVPLRTWPLISSLSCFLAPRPSISLMCWDFTRFEGECWTTNW